MDEGDGHEDEAAGEEREGGGAGHFADGGGEAGEGEVEDLGDGEKQLGENAAGRFGDIGRE